MPNRPEHDQQFDVLLREYENRKPKFNENDISRRLSGLTSAHAMAELNDGPPLNERTRIVLRLLAEGKIDSTEYRQLCELALKEQKLLLRPEDRRATPH
jgi:hypothetical protein